MAHCPKCGNNRPTKRAAGVFFCQHCGMIPGQHKFDRAGNPTQVLTETLTKEPSLART